MKYCIEGNRMASRKCSLLCQHLWATRWITSHNHGPYITAAACLIVFSVPKFFALDNKNTQKSVELYMIVANEDSVRETDTYTNSCTKEEEEEVYTTSLGVNSSLKFFWRFSSRRSWTWWCCGSVVWRRKDWTHGARHTRTRCAQLRDCVSSSPRCQNYGVTFNRDNEVPKKKKRKSRPDTLLVVSAGVTLPVLCIFHCRSLSLSLKDITSHHIF